LLKGILQSTRGAGVTTTDKSGTITTGGTAQTVMASNTARRGYFFQNNSSSTMWISTITTAVASQPSIRVDPGDSVWNQPGIAPTGALSVICATTGATFSAREYT
jgi:hypothetical protein